MFLIDRRNVERVCQKDGGKEWGKFVKCSWDGVVDSIVPPIPSQFTFSDFQNLRL